MPNTIKIHSLSLETDILFVEWKTKHIPKMSAVEGKGTVVCIQNYTE